jgi:hypothetical protein
MIRALWTALRAGEELKDATTWKNRQDTASRIMAGLGLLAVILRYAGVVTVDISQEDLIAIAGGIAAVLGIINSVGVLATSKKVGKKVEGKDHQ